MYICVTTYQVASSCASVQSSARCDRPQQTWPSVVSCIPLLPPFQPAAAVPSSLCSLDAPVADLVAAGSEPLRQPIQLHVNYNNNCDALSGLPQYCSD